MKSFFLALVLALGVGLGLAPRAHAQLAVIDPINLIQNILTATRSLQQIQNQIQQIQNQARMLVNQARHLQGLDFSSLAALRAALAETNRLIEEARGLAYRIEHLDAMFEQLYPEAYDAAISAGEMVEHAEQRWKNVLEGLRTTMRMQAQAARNLAVDEGALSDLVQQSQNAVGQLQVGQATNQLLALAARQAIQAQQLQLTQDRVGAAERARAMGEEARAREIRRRFRGTGVRYTPYPVEFYND